MKTLISYNYSEGMRLFVAYMNSQANKKAFTAWGDATARSNIRVLYCLATGIGELDLPEAWVKG